LLARAAPDDPRGLARELIARSTRLLATDPRAAERSAALASDVLERFPVPQPLPLRLAALLHRANALRTSEPSRAGRLLDTVESRLDAPASAPLRGDLHLLAALVRHDQGLTDSAASHLHSALQAYAAADDPARLARLLVHVAAFLRSTGDLPGAVAVASYAVQTAESTGATESLLPARHNLAAYLLDAGESREAHHLLVDLLPLHRARPSPHALLRYRWLTARLASATGDLAGALSAYETLEADLRAARRFHEAALLLVECARFLLDLHDPHRARALLLRLLELAPQLPAPRADELRRLLSRLKPGQPPSRLLLHRLTLVLRDA
ncbi:MAG: hypothetical protein ACOC92_02265, partial [bacterium]